MGVAEADFLLAIPGDTAAQLVREHAQQAEVCGVVDGLNVTNRPTVRLDRAEEVRLEWLDILRVGVV